MVSAEVQGNLSCVLACCYDDESASGMNHEFNCYRSGQTTFCVAYHWMERCKAPTLCKKPFSLGLSPGQRRKDQVWGAPNELMIGLGLLQGGLFCSSLSFSAQRLSHQKHFPKTKPWLSPHKGCEFELPNRSFMLPPSRHRSV